MAPPSINTRITLTGLDEVLRHLKELAEAGERAGNRTRAALLGAMGGANDFSKGAKSASASSGQMRFALQNLSFQVNDVATSLASGGDVMRVFAQQGGQIFQVFQQGGGPAAVFGGAASAIRSMISPMALAAGGALALTAAIFALIARSVNSETAAKQFNVQLEGLGKSSRITGQQLEEAAHRLRDIGLSASDARKHLQAVIAGGLFDPNQAERIIRIGNDLNRVFGEGTLEKFRDAAAQGGEPLRQFAERLGLVPRAAAAATAGIQGTALAISQSTQSIFAAVSERNRAIADEQRSAARQITDLTRTKGTAEEEIVLASSRRIEEINRQSNRALNELIAARNAENAKSLAAYNKQIEDAAQKAATGGDSILTQIEAKVKGLDQKALGPTEAATRRLGVAWDDMLTKLSQSQPVQSTITDFTNLFNLVTNLNKALADMAANRNAALGSGAPVATAPIPGRAAGGLITGPGTGTSDSILSRLSNGEFVMNALATRMNLPILQAMNALNRPIMPQMRMPRGFASGGLVAAGGGGSPIYLTFPGGTTVGPMMADRQVRQAMEREGKRAAMLSAGKRPSTA